MRRAINLAWAGGLCMAAVLAAPATAGSDQAIEERFELYQTGTFPACAWLDAGTFGKAPLESSGSVETTPGPAGGGGDTQAFAMAAELSLGRGIYRPHRAGQPFIASVDFRIEQFSDAPDSETNDWPLEVGFGVVDEALASGVWPQSGVYVSSLSRTFRLFAAGVTGTFLDLDYGVAAEAGVWYRMEYTLLDAAAGEMRARVWNVDTGALLLDQTDTVEGWTPEDGAYDQVILVGGDGSEGNTQPSIATLDNVVVGVEADAPTPPCVDPACPTDLDGSGTTDSADLNEVLAAFGEGCE